MRKKVKSEAQLQKEAQRRNQRKEYQAKVRSLKRDMLKKWDYYYHKLEKYKKAFGHCNVPPEWDVDPDLALWVQHLRKIQNRLSPSYKNMLLKLGFNLNFKNHSWNEKFNEFKAFVRKHKHGLVPSDKQGDYRSLYLWILRQKRNMRSRKLSKEQIEKLTKAGIVWDIKTVLDENWEKRYKELVAYKRRYGNTLVPNEWVKNPDLGEWVSIQRQTMKQGKLRKDRKKMLDELGFEWPARKLEIKERFYMNIWMRHYRKLLSFRNKYGHVRIPDKCLDFPELTRWVRTQRNKARNNKLTEEQITLLEEAGISWDPIEEHWSERYEELVAFRQKFGHVIVPPTHGEYSELGKWLYHIKAKKSRLPAERVKMLDKLGVDWNIGKRETLPWMEMYNQLVAFREQHGHVGVTKHDNEKLRRWLYKQRVERTPLTEERRKLLLELGVELKEKQKESEKE